VRSALVHGTSNNWVKRLEVTDARELLGYAPEDDQTRANPKPRPLKLAEAASALSRQHAGQQSGLREEL
jgi:hypothetical protein